MRYLNFNLSGCCFLLIILNLSLLASAENSEFAWARHIRGIGHEIGFAITTDSEGNVYTTGHFTDTVDFDPGIGKYELTSDGGELPGGLFACDMFVLKINRKGKFVWAKKIGGPKWVAGYGIAVDNSDNVYVTGMFTGTVDFDPGPETYELSTVGEGLFGYDIFVLKLDKNGNFGWAKSMGGTGADAGSSIAVDSIGNVYVVGSFDDTVDFDPGPETYELTSNGGSLFGGDIFILKLTKNGIFAWARRVGGEGADSGYGIALDNDDNLYVTGFFEGTVDFNPRGGIYTLTSAGYGDIFVLKLNKNGKFIWARQMGGTYYDIGRDIAVDDMDNVYVTGNFGGVADFDPSQETFSLTESGYQDIFIASLDTNGIFRWAVGMGGASQDSGTSIDVDSMGNIYATGFFRETTDFGFGSGDTRLTSLGDADIFVLKMGGNGDFKWVYSMGGIGNDGVHGIVLDINDNIFLTGGFTGTADFAPGRETYNLSETPNEYDAGDMFIVKLGNEGLFNCGGCNILHKGTSFKKLLSIYFADLLLLNLSIIILASFDSINKRFR